MEALFPVATLYKKNLRKGQNMHIYISDKRTGNTSNLTRLSLF